MSNKKSTMENLLAMKAELEALGCKVTITGSPEVEDEDITVNIVYPPDVPPPAAALTAAQALVEAGFHQEQIAPYNPVEDESQDTYFRNMLDDEGNFYDETPDGKEYYDNEGEEEYVSERLEQMWSLQEVILARLLDPPVDASTQAIQDWNAANRKLAEKLKRLQAMTDEEFASLEEEMRAADDASNFGQDDPAES